MGGYWSSKKDPEEDAEKKQKKRKRNIDPDGHQGKKLLVANPYVLKRTGYEAVKVWLHTSFAIVCVRYKYG